MLKDFIKTTGETQEVWARRLGVGQAYLSLLLNGKKTPGLDLAVRIARATHGAVPVESWVPLAEGPSHAAPGDEVAA